MQTQHNGNGSNGTSFSWPAEGGARVPYQVFYDPDIYAQEQNKLFRGPIWNYVALEAEVAQPGDFKATFIGDTPVVVHARQSGRAQRLRESLRASRRHGLPGTERQPSRPTPASTTSGAMISKAI